MERSQRYASAAVLLTPIQAALIGLSFGGFLAEVSFLGLHGTLELSVGLIILFYLVFTGYRHLMWLAAKFYTYPSYDTLPDPTDPTLPTISLLFALRDEAASVGSLVRSVKKLRYRKDRLEVLFLIDEDDYSTLAAVRSMHLPDYLRVIAIPDAGPNLKPKVLNYGYPLSMGEIVAPADAEDRIPEDQLLKVVATYRARPKDRRGRPMGGVQAGLTFWNPRGANGKSWISSLVYAEYCVQYLDTLPGMAALGLPFPYGGTSCYFARAALDDIAHQNGHWNFPHRGTGENIRFQGPWDLNPTEDADIAWRLALAGWGSTLVDSFTNEEAPERVKASGNQGTRWLHGYGITGIVSMRRPLSSMSKVGVFRWIGFNLFVLGTLYSLVLNPVTWATTILYVVSRLEGWMGVSTYIHGLFPAPVFYAGLLATAANFSLYVQKIFAVIRAQERGEIQLTSDPLTCHKQTEQYGITLRIALATPIWWAWRSVSAWRAHIRLVNPKKNQSWGHKTFHGRAIHLEEQLAEEP